MFAVGPSNFEVPYSFYQYQSTVGFTDTSTLSNAIGNLINTSLISTTNGIGFTFQSTIPFTRWISTNDEQYQSPFPVSGWEARIIDFVSTTSNFQSWPVQFQTTPIYLGRDIPALLASKEYIASVDFQYSISISTNTAVRPNYYTWASTIAYVGSNSGTVGRQIVTRLGNQTYTTLQQKLVFNPQTSDEQTTNGQFGTTPSSFWFQVVVQSNTTNTVASAPAFDVYVPGQNNLTFTLTPFRSTIT